MEHNYREIETRIGDRDVLLNLGNCGIALFRLEPEKDYLDYWEQSDENVDSVEHWWVFKHREMLIWMGGICIQAGDEEILQAWEEANGPFTDLSGGWRPRTYVEDEATPAENEMFIQSNLKDLGDTVPEEFLDD